MTAEICPPNTPFSAAVEEVRSGEKSFGDAVGGLVQQMDDDQLLWLLDGDAPMSDLSQMMERFRSVPFEAGRIEALGIPGLRFTDGPRGVVLQRSTCFPVSIARAATFDVELERSVGEAIGKEARVHGATLYGGVCVNLAPVPGWGRSQESYGEDPLLLGAMGAALTTGVNPWVLSTVKHYALNSMEEARFRVDVRVGESALREVYLPHFRSVVEAGVDSVMTSYNAVNGEWAGENRHLITDVLRDDWGFRGFVHTDWIWGLRHPVESVLAGQDLEMPFRQQRARALPRAIRDGRLSRADIERAAARLLGAQVQLALRARPTPDSNVVASAAHVALAREVAQRGCVLLRNETVAGTTILPLASPALKSLALFGHLAARPNLGDLGSSAVTPPSTSSILDGLREVLGERVAHCHPADPNEAARAARDADVAVVVVGFTELDEGESLAALDARALRLMGGHLRFRPVAMLASMRRSFAARRGPSRGGDRHDLHLSREDVRLIRAVAGANSRTVVIVIAGGTVMLDPWEPEVPAILLAWYPGMEGGRAIASLLFGEAEPTGRLPLSIPRRREDLPVVSWRARAVDYPRWWGQRKLDRDGTAPAHPFGFGLGYTTFAVQDLTVGAAEGEQFTATVRVTNTGARVGRHVVQVYATLPTSGNAVRELVGFQPVQAGPGEQVAVTLTCSMRPLQRWNGTQMTSPQGKVYVEAGSWSGDPFSATAVLDC